MGTPKGVSKPHYGKDVRDLAYEIWRHDTSRPLKHVIEVVLQLTGHEVPYDTISDWKKRDEWQVRRAKEAQSLSPRQLEKHLGILRVAAPEALSLLRSHLKGQITLSKTQVEVAKFLVAENRYTAQLIVVQDTPTPLLGGGGAPSSAPPQSMVDLLDQEAELRKRSLPLDQQEAEG